MNKETLLLVDTDDLSCITTADYTPGDLSEYGKQYIQDELNLFKKNFYNSKTLSEAKYWLKQAKIYRNKKLEVMSYNDFYKLKRNFYLSKPIEEITKNKFYEMLDILQPLNWVTINGTNEFCMQEFTDDCYTQQFARKNGKYYSKTVDAYDKSTWIHNYIK